MCKAYWVIRLFPLKGGSQDNLTSLLPVSAICTSLGASGCSEIRNNTWKKLITRPKKIWRRKEFYFFPYFWGCVKINYLSLDFNNDTRDFIDLKVDILFCLLVSSYFLEFETVFFISVFLLRLEQENVNIYHPKLGLSNQV